MGARAEARERTMAEVLRLAREQLADVGAPALSLRAIARDLGLVSSAVYRYFPSRDALLTALIIEAYDEFGSAAEQAERAVDRGDLQGRIRAVALAMRHWALANPNEYALIYGSPVPGYAAPEETIAPAARIPVLLLDILRDIPDAGDVDWPFDLEASRAIDPLRTQLAPDVEPRLLSLGYTLWEFLIGAISVEVFGHQVNVIDAGSRRRQRFFTEQVRMISTLILRIRA